MLIQSKKIWIADQFIAAIVATENGKITDILPYGSKPVDVDYGDKRIVPGFLDIHCHGAFEFDTMMRMKKVSATGQKTLFQKELPVFSQQP